MKKILICLIFLLFLIGCSPQQYKISVTENIIGTDVSITIYDHDTLKSKEAINQIFDEIKRIDSLMSNYKEDSEISILNNEGYILNASSDLIFLLEKSHQFSKISNGSFDITVEPILELYKKSFKVNGIPPNQEEISQTLENVGYRNVMINNEDVIFLQKGVKITLGGIAKGFIADRSIEILIENGIKNALVNAGGDIRAIGEKPNKEKWQIALQNPRNENDYITIIGINNKSVATSGDYERYFDESKKFHHIINPKTGTSALDLISVTIIAEDSLSSDALATAVFVMGPKKGLKLIESLDSVEGLIITRDKEIIKSSGFIY